MTIQVGDKLPEGVLYESAEFDSATGCPLKPAAHSVSELSKDKKIVLFAVPGAFTPTCSAQHLPGYVELYEQLKARGVDEIWCLSVNDAFVMAAWGKDRKVEGKVRMLADGSAEYAGKLGLQMDLVAKGMGIRAQRFALVANNGIVTHVAVEAPGKFEVSNAEAILASL